MLSPIRASMAFILQHVFLSVIPATESAVRRASGAFLMRKSDCSKRFPARFRNSREQVP